MVYEQCCKILHTNKHHNIGCLHQYYVTGISNECYKIVSDTLNMYTVQYKYSKSGICEVCLCLCKSVMTSSQIHGDIVGRLTEL